MNTLTVDCDSERSNGHAASYYLCGFTVETEIPFPELIRATGTSPVCSLRVVDRQPPGPPAYFLRTQLTGGRPWLSLAKCDAGFLLRFERIAAFLVSPLGNRIDCHSEPGVPAHTIRHLFLDAVFPLVLNLLGHHTIHATAVSGPYGCCAFLGDSGLGKSTLAAGFLARGWELVCDDCLRIVASADQLFAIPSYGGLRLWNDATVALLDKADNPPVAHYTGKTRVLAGATRTQPAPLRHVYLLAKDSTCSNTRIDAVPNRDAFIELLRQSFRLDIADRGMLSRQFRFLEEVVASTAIRRLVYPRDFASLPTVIEAIASDVAQGH